MQDINNINSGVRCDVADCKHNLSGLDCNLKTIKVTYDYDDCSCCHNYVKR